MEMNNKHAPSSGWALAPFLVFAAFYVGLSLWAGHLGFEMPWYKVSMPVAFLVASAASFFCEMRSAQEAGLSRKRYANCLSA